MEPLHVISESATGDGTVMGNDQLFRDNLRATGVASTDERGHTESPAIT
jgi:hypothetical protein